MATPSTSKDKPATMALTQHPVVQRLRSLIEEQGYSLDMSLTLPSGSCGGYMVRRDNAIAVSPYDADGSLLTVADFCFFLAHETRHMQHVIEGLFPSYYNLAYDEAKLGGVFGAPSLAILDHVPSLGEGLAAERDCDQYGITFVRENIDQNYKSPTPYLPANVCGYADYCAKESDIRLGLVAPARALEARFQYVKNRVETFKTSQLSSDAKSNEQASINLLEKAPGLIAEISMLRKSLAALHRACGPNSLVKLFCTSATLSLLGIAKEFGGFAPSFIQHGESL